MSSRRKYKTAGPIIDDFVAQNAISSLASLTPAQLNTLYDRLATSDAQAWPCGPDESNVKTNLLVWIRRNRQDLATIPLRGTWSQMVKKSIELRAAAAAQELTKSDIIKGEKQVAVPSEPTSVVVAVAPASISCSGSNNDTKDVDVLMQDRRISYPTSPRDPAANIGTTIDAICLKTLVHTIPPVASSSQSSQSTSGTNVFDNHGFTSNTQSVHAGQFHTTSTSAFGDFNAGGVTRISVRPVKQHYGPAAIQVQCLERHFVAAVRAFAAGQADVAAMEMAKAGAVIAPFLPALSSGCNFAREDIKTEFAHTNEDEEL